LQQITLDNDQKYYIFGIKFNDIYIPVPEDNIDIKQSIKFFVYEKTYLFISIEPLCRLFENIFYFILYYKKLNFCNYLVDLNSLTNKKIITKFNKLNNENVRIIILNILYRIILLLKCLIIYMIKNF
jgi:hypothetical protein